MRLVHAMTIGLAAIALPASLAAEPQRRPPAKPAKAPKAPRPTRDAATNSHDLLLGPAVRGGVFAIAASAERVTVTKPERDRLMAETVAMRMAQSPP